MWVAQWRWTALGGMALLALHATGTVAAQGTGGVWQTTAQQGRQSEAETLPPGQAKPPQTLYEAITERVRLGGYGSFRYEANDLDAANNSFDFRRFVLTLDARPFERLHFNFELEFERFTVLELERKIEASPEGIAIEQAIEGSNESELRIEQAWM
jgi:hypothetical protein